MPLKKSNETPTVERKRMRLEAREHSRDRGMGNGNALYAPKMLPFVSPERLPQGHGAAASTGQQNCNTTTMLPTPLQVRAVGRATHTAIPSPVRDHMALTRKKIRSSINAHKNHARRQLEQQYLALREKIVVEIEDAEQQFNVLQQANESINAKTEAQLKAMDGLVATEIMKIEKARTAAITSTAQLYTKEKQKILQHFDAEIDALST